MRHRTTTSFAALDNATDEVIGALHRHDRSNEFLQFFRTIDANFSADRKVHWVEGNYGTHTIPSVKDLFARYSCFQMRLGTSLSQLPRQALFDNTENGARLGRQRPRNRQNRM